MTETQAPPPDLQNMTTEQRRLWFALQPKPAAVRIMQAGIELDGSQWVSALAAALVQGWQPPVVYRVPAVFSGAVFHKEITQVITHTDQRGQLVREEAWRVLPDTADAGGWASWLVPGFRVRAADARALGQALVAAGPGFGYALGLALNNATMDIDIE